VLVPEVGMAVTEVIPVGNGPITHTILTIPIAHTTPIIAIAHIIPMSVALDNFPVTSAAAPPLSKRKPLAYAMASQEAKPGRYHFRHTLHADEMTPQRHNGVSAETDIKQIPRDKAHTLSLGTPLLGLDPRSPSTWALYREMLPFIFSEAPTPTSDRVGAPRHREEDTGM
jgi:hypothetical protein